MKTIYRTKHTVHFTTLPNSLLRDKKLSFRARGVLAMVLSNAEEWEVTQVWLRDQGPEGKQAVAASLRELEVEGYAVFAQERNKAGVFVRSVWTFHDAPVEQAQRTNATTPKGQRKPVADNPLAGNPVSGEPVGGLSDTKKEQPPEALSKEPAPAAAVPTFATLFVEQWSAAYETDRHVKYVFSGAKDGSAVKRLSAIGVSASDLIAMVRRAWRANGKAFFYCGKCTTIAEFAAFFNQVRAELSARPSGPAGARVASAAQLAADAKTEF